MDDFWRRSDVRVRDIREDRAKRTTVEIQQAIRFNLFHILQASARAEDTGVPAKGLTGQAYEGHYFWDTEIYLLPFLIVYLPPDRQESADLPLQDAAAGTSARQAIGPSRSHVPVAHHQRGRSLGLLRRRNRTVPHQCRHHVRAAQVCAGDGRRAVPAGLRRRDARGNGTSLAGPGLLLGRGRGENSASTASPGPMNTTRS